MITSERSAPWFGGGVVIQQRDEFSAGGGWVTDSDRRDGMYGRIGLLVRK